jgi:hypothetical protein
VKRVLLLTAAVVAAVAMLIAFTLPPVRLTLPPSDDGTVSGVMHIHTNRSDGHGSPEDVAAAAARAGVKFVVLTDHGDATRPPDPPVYREGVLCLDGVEISTKGGHYVAIGLPAAPYPLGGEPRDVVEDVARLGGFGIVSHPDSPKQELQWAGWTAPFDGIEIVNPDTSWRILATQGGFRSKLRLFAALGHYPFRPPEAIAGLVGDSSPLLARWEKLTRHRRVVAVAGTDAHGQIGDRLWSVPIPPYESSFNMLSVRVKLADPLSGDAAADAAAILQGLRAGHVYSSVDGFAAPPSFEFSAANRAGRAAQGDELPAAGPVTLTVRSNAPKTFTTTVWRGDRILEANRPESSFTVTAPEGPAVYRIEIHASDRPGRPLWIASNPIYVRAPRSTPANPEPGRGRVAVTQPLFDGRDLSAWRVEEGPTSEGTIDGGTDGVHLRYQLGTDEPVDRVALLASFPQFAATYDRVTFSARADRPMRISVQLRTGRPGVPEERWQRSVYVDTTARAHTVYFDDLTPAGVTTNRTPPLADMPYLSFVVDATHSKPGAAGELWVSDVALQR